VGGLIGRLGLGVKRRIRKGCGRKGEKKGTKSGW